MGRLICLNFNAKAFHRLYKNLDKRLILLHSLEFDGSILTQEAYEFVKTCMSNEDLKTHLGTPIDPLSASYLCDFIVTLSDLKQRKGEKTL